MAEKPTIIYLVANIFTKRDSVRYGCEYFAERGYNCVVVETTPIWIENYDGLNSYFDQRVENTIVCHTFEDAFIVLEENKKSHLDCVVDFSTFDEKLFSDFKESSGIGL